MSFRVVMDEDHIGAQEEDYLYIRSSQISGAGKGLFTAIPIYKDEFIALFRGEILSQSEANLRADRGLDRYFIHLLNGSILDPANTKCFAKYANDAKGSSISEFKNNSIITLDERDRVSIRAIRNIKVNEEIFCGYGELYWKKHRR